MVRAGLGAGWRCAMANDIDPAKCAVYRENWGDEDLVQGDIKSLDPKLLQTPIDLYWASSPCQDFSLAGKGQGLTGARSGVFTAWMDQVTKAIEAGFAPKIIAFENVTGLVSGRQGRDFSNVLRAFVDNGYRVGAVEIDASHFLPQSRPRVFVIALRNGFDIPGALLTHAPQPLFHSKRLLAYQAQAPKEIRDNWLWWQIPAPAARTITLSDVIDASGPWMDATARRRLFSLMNPLNRQKLEDKQNISGLHIGTVYKRGRPNAAGATVQQAELRFDGLSGCLRTPGGGSSRQTIVVVDDGKVKARLLSTREAARLMGLPDSFRLPGNYNAAYKFVGDGVAVPVVRHLAQHLFEPLLAHWQARAAA